MEENKTWIYLKTINSEKLNSIFQIIRQRTYEKQLEEKFEESLDTLEKFIWTKLKKDKNIFPDSKSQRTFENRLKWKLESLNLKIKTKENLNLDCQIQVVNIENSFIEDCLIERIQSNDRKGDKRVILMFHTLINTIPIIEKKREEIISIINWFDITKNQKEEFILFIKGELKNKQDSSFYRQTIRDDLLIKMPSINLTKEIKELFFDKMITSMDKDPNFRQLVFSLNIKKVLWIKEDRTDFKGNSYLNLLIKIFKDLFWLEISNSLTK